jgi:(p)ppGpp synthase/HD superfamily hydrolase
MAMQIDKPNMDQERMMQLRSIAMAPYMQLATSLIGQTRHAGGNMFRHQIDTLGILIDYGYIDSVLLKASVIHDLLEDIPDFDRNKILEIDDEAEDVIRLVLEVTKKRGTVKERLS